jgi:hypothetical protein
MQGPQRENLEKQSVFDRSYPWPRPGNGTMPIQPPPPSTIIVLIPIFIVFGSVLLLLSILAIQKLCARRGLRRGNGVYPGVPAWFVVEADGKGDSGGEKMGRIQLNDDFEQQDPSSLGMGNASIVVSPPSPRLEPIYGLDYDQVGLLADEALDNHGKQSLKSAKSASPKKRRRQKTLVDTWRATFSNEDYTAMKNATYNSRQPPASDRLERLESPPDVPTQRTTDPLSFQDRLRHINIRPSTEPRRASVEPLRGFMVNQDLHGSQLPSPPRTNFFFVPTQSVDETPVRDRVLVDASDPFDDIMGWGGVSIHDGGSITFRKSNERSVTSNVSLRPERGGIAYFESLYSLLGTDHAWVMAFRSAQAAQAQQAAAQQAALFNAGISGPATQFWLGSLFNTNLPHPVSQPVSQPVSDRISQPVSQPISEIISQPGQTTAQSAQTIAQPDALDSEPEEDRAGLVSTYDDQPNAELETHGLPPIPSSTATAHSHFHGRDINGREYFNQRVELVPGPPSVQMLLQQPPGRDELMEVEDASNDGELRRTTVYMPSRATLSSLLPTPGDSTVQVATGLVTRPYPPFLLPGRMDSSVAYVSGSFGAYIVGIWVESGTGKTLKRVIDLGKEGPWVARQGDTVGVGHISALGGVFFTVNGKRVPVNESFCEQTSQTRMKRDAWRGVDAWVESNHVVLQTHAMMSTFTTEQVVELVEWMPYLVFVGAHWNWYANVGATGPCQILVNMGRETDGVGVGGRDGYLWEGVSTPRDAPPPFDAHSLDVTPISAPADLGTVVEDRRKSIGHRAKASLDAAFSRIFTRQREDLPVILDSSFRDIGENLVEPTYETHRGRLVTDPMPIIDAALDNEPILSETARNILSRSSDSRMSDARVVANLLKDTPPEYSRVASVGAGPTIATIGLDAL